MVSLVRFARFSLSIGLVFFLFVMHVSAQHLVEGVIYSKETRTALAGASIRIVGSPHGTLSDSHGKFKLDVGGVNAVLAVSYPGFDHAKILCEGCTSLSIALKKTKGKEKFIITGYQKESEKELISSVSRIQQDDLQVIPSSSFTSQLQGRLAGVMVDRDLRPGGEDMVRIRGFGTINDSDPLYIIDGLPVEGGLNMISPSHIKEVSVLKDASATAIYGARAGNGVILITTKHGHIGKPKIELHSRYGMHNSGDALPLLNTLQLGELLYHSQKNDYLLQHQGNESGFVFQHAQYGDAPDQKGFIPDYVFPTGAMEGDPGTQASAYQAGEPWHLITKANPAGTHWQKEVLSPSTIQEHGIGVNGGSKYAQYYMGLNYFNEGGMLRETGFERFSIRSNSKLSPTPWLSFGQQLEASYGKTVSYDPSFQTNPLLHAIQMNPMIPIYDIEGNFAGSKGAHLGHSPNPVAQLEREKDNLQQNWRVLGSAFLDMNLLKGLSFKSQIGMDYASTYHSQFFIRAIENVEPAATNSLHVNQQNRFNWTWFNTLRYQWEFNRIHTLNLLAGTEASEGNYRYLYGLRNNFYSDDISYRFLDAGTAGIDNGNGGTEDAISSYFAQGSYALLDRYFIKASVRRDGSSRFGPNHRYGIFPSVNVGWRLSEEPFMMALPIINELKLRASWGQSGNQEIGTYAAYSTFRSSLSASSYDIWGSNTHVVSGFDSQRFGNPDVKWESTTIINVGLDLGLFRLFRFQADVYQRKTTDLLSLATLPGVQGEADAPYQNQGEMMNTGADISLSFKGRLGKKVGIDLRANVSGYRNELISLGNDGRDSYEGRTLQEHSFTRSVPGYPISSFWGLQINGFTAEQDVQNGVYDAYYDRPGRFKFVDQNKDGRITEDDQVYLGSPHPDLIYGLNASLTYAGFDLGIFVQGVQGNELVNFPKTWTDFAAFPSNRSLRMLEESWTPELGDQAILPVLSQNDVLSHQPSSYFVEDGSYLRVQEMHLGYSFRSMRIYIQSLNLFTFSSYQGLNPEVGLYQGDNHLFGVDTGVAPAPRTFLVGMSLGL